MDRLSDIVTQVLESNRETSQRLANIELPSRAYPPSAASMILRTASFAENVRATTDGADVTEDNESAVTIREVQTKPLSEITDASFPSFNYTFDEDLRASRPYLRASDDKMHGQQDHLPFIQWAGHACQV